MWERDEQKRYTSSVINRTRNHIVRTKKSVAKNVRNVQWIRQTTWFLLVYIMTIKEPNQMNTAWTAYSVLVIYMSNLSSITYKCDVRFAIFFCVLNAIFRGNLWLLMNWWGRITFLKNVYRLLWLTGNAINDCPKVAYFDEISFLAFVGPI